MIDLIIRGFKGRALTLHVKSPAFAPEPGGAVDGIEVYHVLGAPDEVSLPDVLNIFGEMDHTAPRFVWTWEDFVRRVPAGPALTVEQASELSGLSAFTLRQYAGDRRLPTHQLITGGRGGNNRYGINESDLKWFMANARSQVGRPKKS